jgi:hypothetical protein
MSGLPADASGLVLLEDMVSRASEGGEALGLVTDAHGQSDEELLSDSEDEEVRGRGRLFALGGG